MLPPHASRRLNAGAAVVIFILTLSSSLILWTADHTTAMWVDVTASLGTYLFLVVLMFTLYRFGRGMDDEGERRMVTSFSLFYSMAFCSIIVVALLPEEVMAIPGVFVLLSLNLFPIHWLRRHFLPLEADTASVLDDPVLFDTFCEQHGISNREREIAELIVQGKSNKEIEDQLFISLNTVKNHIYRLFRKLDVNSRSQFIHMLLQERQIRNRNS